MEMLKGTKIERKGNHCDFYISFPMTEELFNAIVLNLAKMEVSFINDYYEEPLTDDEIWHEIEDRKKVYILGLENICIGDVEIIDYDAETQTVQIKTLISDPDIIDLTLEQTPNEIIITTTFKGNNFIGILTINKKDGSFSDIHFNN